MQRLRTVTTPRTSGPKVATVPDFPRCQPGRTNAGTESSTIRRHRTGRCGHSSSQASPWTPSFALGERVTQQATAKPCAPYTWGCKDGHRRGRRHLWVESKQVGALGIPTAHQPSALLPASTPGRSEGKGWGGKIRTRRMLRVEDWRR